MSLSMWARPLTASELEFFHKSETGRKASNFNAVAIMGRDDLYYIKNLNEKVVSITERIGDNSYDTKYIGGGPASGGKKIPILGEAEIALGYLVNSARDLGIPVYSSTSQPDIIYFNTLYIDRFLQAFSYADHSLKKWSCNRSTLSKWVGGIYPDISSGDSKAISNGIKKILKGE